MQHHPQAPTKQPPKPPRTSRNHLNYPEPAKKNHKHSQLTKTSQNVAQIFNSVKDAIYFSVTLIREYCIKEDEDFRKMEN